VTAGLYRAGQGTPARLQKGFHRIRWLHHCPDHPSLGPHRSAGKHLWGRSYLIHLTERKKRVWEPIKRKSLLFRNGPVLSFFRLLFPFFGSVRSKGRELSAIGCKVVVGFAAGIAVMSSFTLSWGCGLDLRHQAPEAPARDHGPVDAQPGMHRRSDGPMTQCDGAWHCPAPLWRSRHLARLWHSVGPSLPQSQVVWSLL
jgi:hypothetical protein